MFLPPFVIYKSFERDFLYIGYNVHKQPNDFLFAFRLPRGKKRLYGDFASQISGWKPAERARTLARTTDTWVWTVPAFVPRELVATIVNIRLRVIMVRKEIANLDDFWMGFLYFIALFLFCFRLDFLVLEVPYMSFGTFEIIMLYLKSSIKIQYSWGNFSILLFRRCLPVWLFRKHHCRLNYTVWRFSKSYSTRYVW